MYRKFSTTKSFRREFGKLSKDEQDAARDLFKRFKLNPFALELGTHRIIRLSALYRETVWSVPVLANLRSLFVVRGDEIVSIAIGSHAIHK